MSDSPKSEAVPRQTASGRPVSVRTLLAQGGGQSHPPFADVVAPIHMATTYERAPDNSFPGGAVYSRDGNPGYRPAEKLLCQLEQGSDALLFSSGMAAAAAVFHALRPGMRVIAPRQMYWALRLWLIEFCQNWRLELAFFDPASSNESADAAGSDNLAALLSRPTDLVWIETPSNPCWDITDIAHAAELAHQAGARLVVDSTVATPVFTQPLTLGADIVMHSATKYLNGHSDVVAGALITATEDEFWKKVRFNRATGGAVPGPFEAWLLTRGMRTLFARVEIAARSAQQIAERLNGHPAVSQVLYPGLESHIGHRIARQQMNGGYSGMLSIRLAAGEQAAIAAAAKVSLFKRATSLGSTESLIEHRASIEGPQTQCPADLLRLSIGIESTEDLINDLIQAI